MMRQETLVRGFPKQRYRAAIEAIDPLNASGPVGLLDVGGFRDNQVLAALVPNTRIVSLNIPNEYHGRFGDITYDGQ